MTVAELIEQLSKLSPDLPVTFGTHMGDLTEVLNVEISAADEGEVAYIEIE